MEGHFSTGQSPQWAVVPMEELYFGGLQVIGVYIYPEFLLYTITANFQKQKYETL